MTKEELKKLYEEWQNAYDMVSSGGFANNNFEARLAFKIYAKRELIARAIYDQAEKEYLDSIIPDTSCK